MASHLCSLLGPGINRRLECRYEPRHIRSKRSLQAELDVLKAAQRQKDAVIAALSLPGQSMEVLQRLWTGEPIESIYETLGCREVLRSSEASNPASDVVQGSTAPDQPPTNAFSASSSSTPTQTWSSSQSAVEQTEIAMGQNTGTGHHGGEMDCDEHVASEYSNEQVGGSMLDYSGFMNLTCNGAFNHFGVGAPNYDPNIPFGDSRHFQQCDANIHHFENVSFPNDPEYLRKSSSSTQNSQTSFSNGSSIESMLWPGSEDGFPPSSDPAHMRPGLSPIASPITISSTESRPASREAVCKSPAKNPFRSPRKQRTNSEVPFRPRARKRSLNEEAPFSRSPSFTEDETQTSREQSVYPSDSSQSRKRHRTASARSYKKQKDQIEFMKAVKLDVEIRNEELKKEHAELWHQVLAIKNALMGHADCKHPTINAWLQAEAADFVRDGVNSHSRKAGTWPVGQ
ncbi:Condensin complex subunit 1 [Colletotrichum sp. SAR11_57]|nr:Condensin complex subunit 1 [Colletotrichum sp. SAR11_57]